MVGEVDPAGNVTCSDRYDVYGAVRGRTGTASTAHGFVGSLGHLSDAATGLVYMRARYYDPQTGRFQSEDPKASGNNWFIYCNNQPTNLSDYTGELPSGLANWSANMWIFIGGLLLTASAFNVRGGAAAAGEGMAAMAYGKYAAQAGALWDSSLTGLLVGSASEASGLQMQASGANAVQFGAIRILTGCLEFMAANVIFACSDDLGEGSSNDLAQAALQMATQRM